MLELSLAEARQMAVGAQGLHLAQPAPSKIPDLLDRLGCLQLDSIQVVRRSQEMVLLARNATPTQVRSFLDHTERATFFEYWAHAASVIPLQHWPLFAFRRRQLAADGWRGPTVDPAAVDEVRRHVKEHGAATITELGGAQGSGWDRSSRHKWAAEWLLATGEFICVRRRRFSRVYEATHHVLSDEQLTDEPSDQECLHTLTGIALSALGVATTDDVADYFRLAKKPVGTALSDLASAVEIRVEGWPKPVWAHAPTLDNPPRIAHDAVTPLSPFDSLIWYRARMRRLFGVEYLLEAYKRAAQRECGYFGMPVLVGTEITGRLALRIHNGCVEVEGHQLRDGADPMHHTQAAAVAARWANAQMPSGSLPWMTSGPATGALR